MSQDATDSDVIDPAKAAKREIEEAKKKTRRNMLKGMIPGLIFMSYLLWSFPTELAGMTFLWISAMAFVALGGIRYDDSGWIITLHGFWMGSFQAFVLGFMYVIAGPLVGHYQDLLFGVVVL